MKKRALLVIFGLILSMSMLFTGCGDGEGAEDTGEDGKVANGTRTTASTGERTDAAGERTDAIGGGDTGTTSGDTAGGMMDDSMIP